MRVAMVIQNFHPGIGGAERQLLQVAPLLQARGVEVHVLTRRHAGLSAFEEVAGIPVHRLPAPGGNARASLTFTVSAQPLLRRLAPDLLHAYELLSPTTTALLAKAWLRRPVLGKVLSAGELAYLSTRPQGRRRLAASLRRVDRFHVVSDEIDAALSRLGVPPERRARVRNGVDARRYRAPSTSERLGHRAALGLSSDVPVAVYTGRLSPEKGVRELLSAWHQVRAQHHQAVLLVVGEGAEEGRLRAAAVPGVQLTGAAPDVLTHLQAADVFVLPSRTEGMSNSLLEAMATGIRVVATAVGGTVELTRSGRLAQLVKPGDPAGLARALAEALALRDQPDPLSAERRARVVDDFSLDATAASLAALYEQMRLAGH